MMMTFNRQSTGNLISASARSQMYINAWRQTDAWLGIVVVLSGTDRIRRYLFDCHSMQMPHKETILPMTLE